MKKSFFILFFLIVKLVKAQVVQDTIYLDEIIVHDNKNYKNVVQIDSVKLQNKFLKNIGDLLQNEAGICIRKYGFNSLQTISIRGTVSHHNILLWNGMPVFSPLNGQINLSNIIYKSNQPIFIGYNTNGQSFISGAFGGVILFNTTINEKDNPFFYAHAQYESLNNKSLYVANLSNIKTLKVKNSLLIQSDKNQFSFFNDAVLPKSNAQNCSKSNQITYNNDIFYKENKILLTLSTQLQKSYHEIPPLMTNLYQVRHEEWNTSQSIQSVLNITYNNSISTTIGMRYTQMEYHLSRYQYNLPITTISSFSDEPTLYISSSYKKQLFSSVFSTTTLRYYYIKGIYKNKIHNIQFNESLHRFELAKTLSKEWKNLSQKAQFSLLKEADKFNVLPSFIHKYIVSKKTELSHTVGYNVRFPYLNELYFIPGGNKFLKPEKAIQSDMIFIFKPSNNIETKISPHFSAYKDWILWYPTSFGYWEAKNIRNINIYGIDYSITSRQNYNKHGIYQVLAYSLLYAKGVDNSYKIHHIPYTPKHKLSYFVQYSYNSFKLINDVAFYSERFPLIYDKYIVLKPYFIWNTALQYEYKALTFNLSADNILNSTYQSILWRPLPGRYYKFSIFLKLNWNEN